MDMDIQIQKEGVILEGIFKDANLNGYGTKNCEQYSYEGLFQSHLRHGYCVCKENDQEYVGFW